MNRRALLSALFLVTLGCGKAGQPSGPNGPAGQGPTGLPSVPGEPDTSVKTALPPVPSLSRVTAAAVADSVSISVEPVAGARDYRVYVLPSDDSISAEADGHVSVANAIYRCAGDRQAPRVSTDGEAMQQSEAIRTLVDGQDVSGYQRTMAEATLGYVYVNPGAGRVPVYALGDPSGRADNLCFHQRWAESRVKRYTKSDAERADLLKKGWRDDGVVFYAAADGSEGTVPVYTKGSDELLYFVAGPEADTRGGGSLAFSVLREVGPADSVPLMRVFYKNGCGNGHDELSAGQARFERARFQGDERPLFDLHWSGITGETTLVVEALDQGCPFPGVLAPVTRAAGNEDGIDYPPFLTLQDAQAASPSGEVFINGQHDPKNRPKAIARSFVKISPGPKPVMDWFTGFGPDEALPDFASFTWSDPCEAGPNPQCLAEWRQKDAFADFSFNSTTQNRNGVAVVLGELWVSYADVGADVGGKFRMTAPKTATVAADAYLHVTMEVDDFTTARRYPQIFISDGKAPVQWTLPSSKALVLQPFPDEGSANWPFVNVVEVCDKYEWDVNNQCPFARLNKIQRNDQDVLLPAPEASERSGVDRSTRFDVFVSSKRVYQFLDDLPYGCIDLPAAGVPSGEVTVTFGDVMYHSGVDEVFAFHEKYQKIVAKRHFDNLGFKSGVPAPLWDAERFPCLPASAIKAQ